MDRTLDRLPEFDERSRSFPIRAAVGDKPLRSYTWRCDTWLDQGQEGQCVGFAWAHDLAARPAERPADAALARSVYHQAQRIDEWPGEAYSGTSVLAGAKVVHGLGHFAEYRWAFSFTDALLAIGYAGPAVLGINWWTGMFDTDSDGFIAPTGQVEGGHAILAYRVQARLGFVELHNSWGQSWGVNGRARLRFADLAALLDQQGEACIPVQRRLR